MIPKPKRRRRRAENNAKPTINDICERCGRPYAHLHEVFFGRGKRQLIKWVKEKSANEKTTQKALLALQRYRHDMG